MPLPQAIRPFVPLLIGLVVGGAGVTLFNQSLTGSDGSAEERTAQLEVELKKAENRLAALDDMDARGRRKSGRTTTDGLREIRDRLQDGKAVTPEDIFRLTQPWMRDLAPLFERMRAREQSRTVEQITGEFARKYGLNTQQQAALRQWFDQKTEENAKEWTNLVTQDGTRLQDLMIAAQDVRPDDGVDQFMERTLTGDKLAQFKTDRMTERVERVQNHADAKTQRLDDIVQLDSTQRDQVFGIMARNSRDYDTSMQLEGGVGEIGSSPGANNQDAMLSVLRPDQRAAYEQEQQRRREHAQKDMEAIGLSLPQNWNPLEMENF